VEFIFRFNGSGSVDPEVVVPSGEQEQGSCFRRPFRINTCKIEELSVLKWSPFPAKTRSASDAEKIRQALEDSHDPDKRRAAAAEAKLKALQAEKESQTVTIEQAIARFLVAKLSIDNIVGSTLDRYKALLGNVDPKFEVKTKGKFLTWLDQQNPRPVQVVDLAPPVIEAFIGSWNFNAQWTKSTNFTALNSFFNYCTDHKWTSENPMERMKRPIQVGKLSPPIVSISSKLG